MSSTTTYRVLYDFAAVEEGELSVSSGQIVVLKSGVEAQDGWAMVHVLNAPEACGFVPVDYLGKMLESGMVESSSTALAAAATATTPRNYSYGSAEAPTTSTALSRTLTSSSSSSSSAAPHFASTASVHHPMGAAEEFSQLFASHEAWFKAATAKRQEVYASLRAEAADVLKALRESEAKSAAVLSRIHEIGSLVAQERGRNNSSRG